MTTLAPSSVDRQNIFKMADYVDEVADSSVGFLYKAMLERDPHKRRVKPVQKHLIQLNFGLEDSSDDSDFEVPKNASDASDVDMDSDAEGSGDGSKGKSGSESGSSVTDGSDESETEAKDVEEELSLGELLEKAKLKSGSQLKAGSEDTTGSSSSRLKLTICCVCLGDNSEEDDEIVECDGCGVSVHEGCYGIAESQSVASTESSASTEPWFCDACKAGVSKPNCELCPNAGGIYKETDAGRWVHIVCALYIPGVAFGDVDRLSPVTLFEMPYTKWGAKECSLCDDERFSRTGVCIGCDAGMCRAYFHVTCAQREGLLSEASPDEEIADPFYAYCRQHGDKMTVRAKRRNYLAIQSYYRSYKHRDHDLDEKEQLRVQRKLNRHRQKYLIARAQRPPSWDSDSGQRKQSQGQLLPTGTTLSMRRRPSCKKASPKLCTQREGGVPKEKVPRLLTTNPSAMRRLMRKAELLGINTQTPSGSKGDIRKKWHVAPALSVGFVSYYLDRNVRINNMKTHLRELLTQGDKLREQESVQRIKYDQLLKEVEELREKNTKLRQQGQKTWDILGALAGKPFAVPEVIKPKKYVRSPSKKDTPRSPPAIIHQCGICQKTTDQHLLAKCDTCHLFYHLGCLDPPLTRMPKKTKQQGWQCSECGASSADDISKKDQKNPNAPRRLRDKIKEPMKFTPIGGEIIPVKKDKVRKKGRKKKTVKRLDVPSSTEPTVVEITGTPEDEVEREMPVLKKERPCRLPKPSKVKDVRTECCVCNLEGDNNNLVRCDECKLCYHFHCLDPPLKKSPKQRGYAWHCTACDPTEGEPILPSKDSKRKRRENPAPKKLELTDLPPPPPPSPPLPRPKQSEEEMQTCEKEHDEKVEKENVSEGNPREVLSDSDVLPMEEDSLPPQLQKEDTD